MASGPTQSLAPPSPPGQDSTTPPATIASMPSTMRRSAFSLKTTQAMTAVRTASRLSSSDAAAPVVRAEIPLANQPLRMHAADGYLFVAQTAEWGAERAGGEDRGEVDVVGLHQHQGVGPQVFIGVFIRQIFADGQ